jgi:hypothetical protein
MQNQSTHPRPNTARRIPALYSWQTCRSKEPGGEGGLREGKCGGGDGSSGACFGSTADEVEMPRGSMHRTATWSG